MPLMTDWIQCPHCRLPFNESMVVESDPARDTFIAQCTCSGRYHVSGLAAASHGATADMERARASDASEAVTRASERIGQSVRDAYRNLTRLNVWGAVSEHSLFESFGELVEPEVSAPRRRRKRSRKKKRVEVVEVQSRQVVLPDGD